MTKAEIDQLIDDILTLYIKEVKEYYNKPRYTEQITPHTMLGTLWRVLDETKERFINLKTYLGDEENDHQTDGE
jgi:hypothetical protein